MMIGDFEGAAEALQASLEIEPARTYFVNLAIIYYYLGRFDDSVSIHRRAIEESPNQHFVWLNYGDALFFSSEPEKAEAAFRRSEEIAENVLQVDPGRADVMYELAWVKAMLGDTTSARQLIEPVEYRSIQTTLTCIILTDWSASRRATTIKRSLFSKKLSRAATRLPCWPVNRT